MSQKSTLATSESVERGWLLVDAKDQVLGRLAVVIANILRGRHKPTYTPHVDTGDFVVVVNANKIRVTGKKESQKTYMFYSGYMGGESYRKLSDLRKTHPERILELAVQRMLPKNKLADQMMKKLKIFAGAEHDHQAQEPIEFKPSIRS
jgi:large subunit ribosomal protein L13